MQCLISGFLCLSGFLWLSGFPSGILWVFPDEFGFLDFRPEFHGGSRTENPDMQLDTPTVSSKLSVTGQPLTIYPNFSQFLDRWYQFWRFSEHFGHHLSKIHPFFGQMGRDGTDGEGMGDIS